MRGLWTGGALGILLGIGSMAWGQLPQGGRAFPFLNGHGYGSTADPGRSFPFLNGHGNSTTADPGRPNPAHPNVTTGTSTSTPASTSNANASPGQSIFGFSLNDSSTNLPIPPRVPSTPASGSSAGNSRFYVVYPGYGLTPYPGFYGNMGIYNPANPYSYGLIPGMPVSTFRANP